MLSGSGQDRLKMIRKRPLLILALMAFILTLACLSVNTFSKSQAPLGLIAYVGNDGNIYTIARNGKQSGAVTSDANLHPASGQEGRIYQYPTWAPDGQHLAFAGFSLGQSGPEVSLFSALPDGKKAINVFSSPNFQPFYLSWSPDSQLVAVLGNDASGSLSQYLVPGMGGESKLISSGQPYYWDWSPDSHTLIVHIGGARSENSDALLAFVSLDDLNAKQELDLKPASFYAPAWSPNGDLVAVASQNDAGEDELTLAGQDGKVKQELVKLSGPVAFGWSPKGGALAYAVTNLQGRTPTVQLYVLDSAHPVLQKQIVRGELVAFFWSPDGEKIVYFMLGSGVPSAESLHAVAQTQSNANLIVWVYNRSSGSAKEVAVFVPTASFEQVLLFYSQYQRSGTIWSPDSQSLVLSGIDSAGENAIYTVGVDGSHFQKIADGDLAFWSWK
jgi:TolB protein